MSIWSQRKIIEELSSLVGEGTSLISIYLPSGTQMTKVSQLITQEFSKASNIKSRVTRQNVQEALKSLEVRIKTA